jgi:hypothetical protein
VLASIDFNDQPLLEANKIENELLKGDLPPKLILREASITEQTPHRQFRIGGLVAHLLCEAADAFGEGSMAWCLRREPLTRRLTS